MNIPTTRASPADLIQRRQLADYMLSTAIPIDPRLPPETLLPKIERAIETMSPGDMTTLLAEMRMKRRADVRHEFAYDPCRSK